MAFVCTLEEAAYIDCLISEGEGEFIARMSIGHCDQTGCVYSLFAALSPYIGYIDVRGMELVFNIIEAQPDGTHIQIFWEGTESLAVIDNRQHREIIRTALATVVRILIETAKPGMVAFTTRSAELPQKALVKYYQVLDAILQAGYTGGKTDQWNGRHTWMADRNEAELPL